VENSSAGPVPEMQGLLPACGLDIVGEYPWRIRMQLMAVPGARLENIKVVFSHPMALKQCTRIIDELGAQPQPAFDTAGAAQALAQSGDTTTAVVAARAAADLYGLAILRADVEDQADNTTRFVVLARP
jgi:prephenate dehydratase